MNQPSKLKLSLPDNIAKRSWDVVLVDGPTGGADSDPGRMQAIHMASELVAPGGCVAVHDCDRELETAYAEKYFGALRSGQTITGFKGELRVYQIPE